MYACVAVCMYILLYTGHIQGQEQACVAMVKMKSKMQSCKESLDWLRSHAWDCDACCHLANRTQTEQGLLLRGVAWNRISWVFSLPLSLLLSASLSQFLARSSTLSCCSLCLCPHWLLLPRLLSPILFFCTSTRAKGERAHVEKFTEYFMQLVVWGWGHIQRSPTYKVMCLSVCLHAWKLAY